MALRHDLNLIRNLEEELFKQTVRGSPDAVSRLLADSFVEFGRSGCVYTRDDVIRSLASEGNGIVELLAANDFDLKSLADDVVLLTYRSRRQDGRRGINGGAGYRLRGS